MKYMCFNALIRKEDGNGFDEYEAWLNPNAVAEITKNEYRGADIHLVSGEIIEVSCAPRVVAEILCE